MTDFHWHLLIVFWQVLLSIGIAGAGAAGYYWRGKYEDISERMHNAIPLLDEGNIEEAREILSDH